MYCLCFSINLFIYHNYHHSYVAIVWWHVVVNGNLAICSAAFTGQPQRKTHQRSTSLVLCEGKLTVTSGYPSQPLMTNISYFRATNTISGNFNHGYSHTWNMTITYLIIEHILAPMCHKLTHLPLDKMAAILADDNFKCIFLNENDRISIRISLKFVPSSPIDNKPALVQVMAWRRRGDKPLPELMLTQFTDAYMRH